MFGGIYFGQYWPEEAVVAGQQGPDPGGAEKRRKRKHRPEDEIWPQPWQYQQPKQPESSPSEPVPVESLMPAAELPTRSIAVVLPQVSPELAAAMVPPRLPRIVIQVSDPAIASRVAEMKRRLRRELEEEEILMLMGFFD